MATRVEQKPISVARCASSATTLIHEIAAATTAWAATVASRNTVPYAHMCSHCPHSSVTIDSTAPTMLSSALPSIMPRTPKNRYTLRHSGEPSTSPTLERTSSTCRLPFWSAVRRA
jgi:hypothetical protein